MATTGTPFDQDPTHYERIPGKARHYVSRDTGEVIARRQYDKMAKLAPQGYKSYEEKAAMRRDLGFPQGPARGRKGVPPVVGSHQVTPKPAPAPKPNLRARFLSDQPRRVSEGIKHTLVVVTKRGAQQAVNLAQKSGARARLKIVAYDTNGKPHLIGSKGGIRPELLANILRGSRTWREALAKLLDALGYPTDAGYTLTGETQVFIDVFSSGQQSAS
jgi:hypothetical protein